MLVSLIQIITVPCSPNSVSKSEIKESENTDKTFGFVYMCEMQLCLCLSVISLSNRLSVSVCLSVLSVFLSVGVSVCLSLTHARTHARTHTHTHAHTHSLTHSLTHSDSLTLKDILQLKRVF